MQRRRTALAAATAAALVAAAATASQVVARPAAATHAAAAARVAAPLAAHMGGTLHLLAKGAGGSLDPQVNYTLQYWQLYQATQDGLMAFTKAGGPAAFTVVPDLAVATPKPTNGGKTWTFTLRKGIKFSNGKPVTVKDVLYSFQRIFKVHTPTAGGFYSVIVGADKCLAHSASCTLKGGVIVNPKKSTVTFNLTRPDPEWLDKLAVPHASIVPVGTPNKDMGTTPIPSTGPYYFSSYDPNHQLTMLRNKYFHVWSQRAQPQGYPDKIIQTFGLTVEAEITQIENGQADWTLDNPPADRLNEIATKYTSQVHVNQLTANWYVPMNVNIPPFNNLKARQAVNWAIDRNAAIRLYGGPKLAAPSCQILPAGFPAHVQYCPYTKGATKSGSNAWTAPDLAKAKQLVKESGTAGQSVGVVVSDDEVNKSIGEYIQSVLNSIGYKATLKPISSNIQFTYIQNTKNKVQISLSQWYQDYPAPSDFLYVLFGCESFHPGSDSSINISGFCNKPINTEMKRALVLGVTNPDAANAIWSKVDRQITDQSAAAVLFNPKLIDFVSKRVGNYTFSKQFYMLVDQAWVQ
jgi:peptide/nickel transport system substrate-binding protein